MSRKAVCRTNNSPVLFWKAATRVMNPKVPQRVIDEAYENDRDVANAEYGANFRQGLASFVSRDVVNAAVIEGRFELPYQPGLEYDSAFLKSALEHTR
jgi:hypothetical protein